MDFCDILSRSRECDFIMLLVYVFHDATLKGVFFGAGNVPVGDSSLTMQAMPLFLSQILTGKVAYCCGLILRYSPALA